MLDFPDLEGGFTEKGLESARPAELERKRMLFAGFRWSEVKG